MDKDTDSNPLTVPESTMVNMVDPSWKVPLPPGVKMEYNPTTNEWRWNWKDARYSWLRPSTFKHRLDAVADVVAVYLNLQKASVTRKQRQQIESGWIEENEKAEP